MQCPGVTFVWLLLIDTYMYSQMLLYHSAIYLDFIYSSATTAAEHKSDIELTKDTPYLTLMGKLWVVCCEDLGKKLLSYNGTCTKTVSHSYSHII